jgi:hypothetical protein
MKKTNNASRKLEAVTAKTLVVGIDIAKHTQWARFTDCRGAELGKEGSSFSPSRQQQSKMTPPCLYP